MKNVKKHETQIVYRTWLVIFTLFVKQDFYISCFVTYLSIECFSDETPKEFLVLRQKSIKIQMNQE